MSGEPVPRSVAAAIAAVNKVLEQGGGPVRCSRYHLVQLVRRDPLQFEHVSQHRTEDAAKKALQGQPEGDRADCRVFDVGTGRFVEGSST